MVEGARDQSYTDASLPVALPPMAGAGAGEAVMIILNDILLFACAIALVTGIVLTAAQPVHLIGCRGRMGSQQR